jgi:Prolyl oligopeptidase family
MNVAFTAVTTLMLAATPALSAGFERVTVSDPDGPPLEAGIWYPSEAPAASQPLGLYRQTVATGGSVVGSGLSLIVMSHGSGGSFEGHYDTALALAEAGFVVAAVTHTGDNYRGHSGFTRVENRSRHVKAMVDYMLASWPHRDLLDPARIGMFGFSAGGFTALVAIGGVPDMTRVAPYCATYPDEWACRPRSSSGAATATKCCRIRAMPRTCTTDCRQSPNITWCGMPAISLSSLLAPQRSKASRRTFVAIPRASIARPFIANSIPPWWPSSRQSWRRDHSRVEPSSMRGKAEEARGQIVASIMARSSGVTSGITPNQSRNAGRAWCRSMPRPLMVRLPRARAAASNGVSFGM